MSPPPSPHTPHCCTPRICPVVVHLAAAQPCHCPLAAAHTASLLPTLPCRCPHMSPPSQPYTPRHHMPYSMAMLLPPSQSHMSHHRTPHRCMGHITPLTAAHAVSPHTSQLHGHIVASLTAAHVATPLSPAWAMLQHALRCCPHRSHTRCTGHVAPLAAAHIVLPCALLLHRPHCRPCSGTRPVTMHLVDAGAMSPPLWPHMSCHCTPRHCMGHIAPLAATHVTSPCISLLHRPRCPPHSHTCHVTVRLAATQASSPPLTATHITACLTAAWAMLPCTS